MASEAWLKRKAVEKVCEYCGETFLARERRARFCSQRCSGKHSTQNQPPRTAETRRKASESLKAYYATHPERKIRGQEASLNAAKGTKGKLVVGGFESDRV